MHASCYVPTCGASVGTFKLFPQHDSLSERWLEAIQMGCGVRAADDGSRQRQICQWHFTNPDDEVYQEPKIFKCGTETVKIDSCRLCLRFYPISDMVSKDGELSELDIKNIVYKTLRIDFQANDFLELVCINCVARLEILRSIQKEFLAADINFHNLSCTLQEGGKEICRSIELSPHAEDILQKEDSNVESDVDMDEEYLSDEWPPPEDEILLNESSDSSSSTSCEEDSKQPGLSLKEIIRRKCYICMAILASANELSTHLTEKHSDMKSNRCEACSRDFPMLSGYNKHLSRHDQTERPHKCSFCPIRFKIKRAQRIHENKHHDTRHDVVMFEEKINPAICETCGKSFKYTSMLTRHIRVQHTVSQEKPNCKICGKSYTRHGSLVRHMQTHTNQRPYSCDKCDANFARLILMKQHVQKVHDGINPYVCKECNLEFKSYRGLLNHRHFIHLKKLNLGNSNPSIGQDCKSMLLCKLCNEIFLKASELQQHIKESHADVSYPYFECPKCPKKFLTKQSLYCHKPKHTDRCICNECGKHFGSAQALRYHKESIHEKRQFNCPICPTKTYKSQSALYTHMILHTKGKRLACDFCEKTFHRKDILTVHRRTHTGEKPFKCPKCLKRFSDDGTFSKHKKRCLTTAVPKKEPEVSDKAL